MMKRWMCGLMLVGVLGLGAVGCVSEATQERIAALTAKVDNLEGTITSVTVQTKELLEAYKAGKITEPEYIAKATELANLLLDTKTQLLDAKTELDSVVKQAEEEGDKWYEVAGLALLNIILVIAGRKLGMPGLASGTVPIIRKATTKKK